MLSERSSLSGSMAWGVFLLLAGLSAAVICPAYLNHDDAWYLHMASEWLRGATLYRDVIDTNPPLIVFLSVPPVWVAEHLGVSSVTVFKAYVFLAELLSLACCARLMQSAVAPSRTLQRTFFAVVVFAVMPFARPAEFGQREHLMVLLILPYILGGLSWLQTGTANVRWALLRGVAAGLGFAMKPHYLVAFVAFELSLQLLAPRRARRFRHEGVAAGAAVLAYGLVVAVFLPQYLSLANVVRQVYGGTDAPTAVLFRLPDMSLWAAGLLSILLLRLRRAEASVCAALFVLWTAFLFAAVIQLKGFSYHLYPARVFMLLYFVGCGLAALAAAPSLATVLRGGRVGLAIALLGALVAVSGRFVLEARRPVEANLVSPLLAVIKGEPPEAKVAVLSMRSLMYPAFPAVNYSGARWTLRHNSLWFLPGLYASEARTGGTPIPPHSLATMNGLEREFFEEIVDDLCAQPPDLLLVEPPLARAPTGRRALDLNAYYGQDQRYRHLATGYSRMTTIGELVVLKKVGKASCWTDTAGR